MSLPSNVVSAMRKLAEGKAPSESLEQEAVAYLIDELQDWLKDPGRYTSREHLRHTLGVVTDAARTILSLCGGPAHHHGPEYNRYYEATRTIGRQPPPFVVTVDDRSRMSDIDARLALRAVVEALRRLLPAGTSNGINEDPIDRLLRSYCYTWIDSRPSGGEVFGGPFERSRQGTLGEWLAWEPPLEMRRVAPDRFEFGPPPTDDV